MSHPLSNVHPDAQIGKNVTISPFVTIYPDVKIGDNTWIGPNVTIMDGAKIGENCKIFPGAVISAIPQDLKYQGEESTVEIGNHTTVRECVTINRGTKAVGTTRVGDHCLLMAYVHIAHDCIVGNNCILVNNVGLAGEIQLGDFVTLGGATIVHQFVRIGEHAFVGGGSKVRIDVPPFIKADREPLSYMGVNSVGLKRRGFSQECINEIQEIYRTIYLRGMNNTQALEVIEKEFAPGPERDAIISFIRESKRGIIRGYHRVINTTT
ncbi:MAG TPA: acyl-ACP--UDP-N-acetylglucosamine O-acyltransferase [Bacteroidetes bacterium]|nr:acyl-ACP--UDP-N-acetylglucosamine O-acyltransferase [Bacteroidota bacterium]